MNIKLGKNAYGKNAVNLSKVIRHEGFHEFRHISVNILLEGDFEPAHTKGDNTKILPTDTQKNTVYALAKEDFTDSIEAFAVCLAHYFFTNNPQVSETRIEITEYVYHRMSFNGHPHPHSFIGGGPEIHMAVAIQNTTGQTISSGIKDLLMVKTTGSGFEHFIKDQYTTLRETSDRILATQCEATWTYATHPPDFGDTFQKIRETLLKTFADHSSLSVQQTLYAIGEAILKQEETVAEISLTMPNKHHILFNLEQFGMENKNEIFIATDEPYGYITGTVVRG